MYAMLGHVAEVLGQDTWENLVTKRIFEPLEMNDTTILKSPADIFQPGVAQPYYYIDDMLQNGTHEIYEYVLIIRNIYRVCLIRILCTRIFILYQNFISDE